MNVFLREEKMGSCKAKSLANVRMETPIQSLDLTLLPLETDTLYYGYDYPLKSSHPKYVDYAIMLLPSK